MLKPRGGSADLLAHRHPRVDEGTAIDTQVCQHVFAGEVKNAAECHFNLVHRPPSTWARDLERQMVLGFSERAVACRAQVDGGCSRRVPPGSARVLSVWGIPSKHVPSGNAFPRLRVNRLKPIENSRRVDHEPRKARLDVGSVAELSDQCEHIVGLASLDAIGGALAAQLAVR